MTQQDSNLKYIRAKNKVEKEKKFYTHVVVYVVVNIMITLFKVWDDMGTWDLLINKLLSIYVLAQWIIWGIFLILHFISFRFGHDWEERKIEAFMNDELSNNSKN